MKLKPLESINRLFENKRFLVAFSLICAVIFWLIIDISENPTREITVSDMSISVADRTDDNGDVLMVLGDSERKVSVTVSGPGYIVSNVTKNDIKLSVVSYSDVNRPGTYVLNLTASVDVSGCRITEISPSYLKVDYDYDSSADIPIEVDMSDFRQLLPADREIYKSSLRVDSDGSELAALSVSGPSEVIGSIAKVSVKPILSSDTAPDTQNFQPTLTFLDTLGNPVDASQLVYSGDIYIRAVVYKVAEVTLKPTFTNLPSCYSSSDSGLPPYTLYNYSETAKSKETVTTVKIRGPVEAVDRHIAEGLELSPIDFMKVTADNTSFNAAFKLDDGVEVIDGTEEITVSLDLGRLYTTELKVSPSDIEFSGLPVGLSATSTITNKTITVKLCYDRDKTKKIAASDIVLTVDLSGITTASSVTKPITVTTTDKSIYAWSTLIDPGETIVEIK